MSRKCGNFNFVKEHLCVLEWLVYLSLRHGFAVTPPSSEGGSSDDQWKSPTSGRFRICRGGP